MEHLEGQLRLRSIQALRALRLEVPAKVVDDLENHVLAALAAAVAEELTRLASWVRDPSNYDRDDARDEIARAIENRYRQYEQLTKET